MWVFFQSMLVGLTGSLVARALTSLGIGFVSYAALTAIANSVVANVNSSYGAISDVPLAMLNLSGFGTALSILTSALVTRASLMAIKKMMPV